MYYSTTDNRFNISIASGSSLYCTRDIITPLNILCNNISVSSATGITKSMVGLANVDKTATQTALDLKANLSSPTFTGTVNGTTKSMVGLSNMDNTSDLNQPISTATQTALDLKANATNGAFENTVTFKNSSGIDFINTDG